MNKQIKNQNGITLIALVVTIIVLLILAAVSLLAVTGNNGLFTKAESAQAKTNDAKDVEQISLSFQEYQIAKYDEENTSFEKIVNNSSWGSAVYDEKRNVTIVTLEENGNVYDVTEDGVISKNEFDTSWYKEGKNELYISSASQLKGLAHLVNGEDKKTFKNITIKLNNDIDLKNAAWTPIGSDDNYFEGVFDGQEHTISNLYTEYSETKNIGLFGATNTGEIKNLNINNANVKGYSSVGAVVGNPGSAKMSNIALTGLVKIEAVANVGGMFGKSVYANISDLTVNVNDESYVKATSDTYSNYVGGVVGFIGEGNIILSDITSNIDVFGVTCFAGGISGNAHYNNTFINCSSSGNVQLELEQLSGDALTLGGIAGTWINSQGTVTLTNCSYTGQLISTFLDGTSVTEFENNGIVGSAYNETGSGTLVIN